MLGAGQNNRRGCRYHQGQLPHRNDEFLVFLDRSRDHKVRKMIARGAIQEKGIGQKGIGQIDTTDKARAAFARPYLGGMTELLAPRNMQDPDGIGFESCDFVGGVQLSDRNAE